MAASTGSGTQGCPTPSRLRPPAPGRGGRPSLREQQAADLARLGGAREHRTRSSVSTGQRSPPEILGERIMAPRSPSWVEREHGFRERAQSMRSWSLRSRGRALVQSIASLMVGISLIFHRMAGGL